jgi:hypothetical protein
MAKDTDLTVALTGPTGTFGLGLVPLLEADHRVTRTIGVARSPFDPAGTAGRRWPTTAVTSGTRTV